MRDLFLIIDEAGAIECAGPAVALVFGYSVAEMLGQPAQRFLEFPERHAVVSAPFAWLSAAPNPILHGIHRDGRRFPLRLTQQEMQGADQAHFVLLLQDPAAAPAAQDVFLQHKELYELATWQGRISVWEVDYRTNHLEFSPVLAHMLGLSDDQIPTSVEAWSKQFYPDDWQALERESGRMLRREIPELNVECRMFRPDGQLLWTLVRGHASFDEHGQPIRSVGTSIDITERKQAEEERDRFFTLSLDLLLILDTQGVLRRVNPAFTRLLGYTIEELTGHSSFEFIHPDYIEPTKAAIGEVLRGKDVEAFENRVHSRDDDTYRWISWTCAALAPGSELLYAVGRDVTHAKEVQLELERAKKEAERANRAKSEFLSRMSHELRTPLNAILGFSQLLQRDPLSERQRKQIDLIGKGGRHLLTLINEVLDITRIEVGRLDLAADSIALADLVHEVVSLNHPMAEQHGVKVEIDEPSVAAARVVADERRLKQVLLNLVSNAIKYNVPKGSVRIRCEPAPPYWLRIHVEDTGIGIAREKHDRLFTPFDRLGRWRSSTCRHRGERLGAGAEQTPARHHGGRPVVHPRAGPGEHLHRRIAARRFGADAGGRAARSIDGDGH